MEERPGERSREQLALNISQFFGGFLLAVSPYEFLHFFIGRPEQGSVPCSYENLAMHTPPPPSTTSFSPLSLMVLLRGTLVRILSFASDRNPIQTTLSKQTNKQKSVGMGMWQRSRSYKDTDREYTTKGIIAEPNSSEPTVTRSRGLWLTWFFSISPLFHWLTHSTWWKIWLTAALEHILTTLPPEMSEKFPHQ